MLTLIQKHCPKLDALLQEAIKFPYLVKLGQLWEEFDRAIVDLDDAVLLQVAGEVIAEIADIFATRATRVAQIVMAVPSRGGPRVPIDFFDQFVVQTMHIDFDQFIEPIPNLKFSPQLASLIEEPKAVIDANLEIESSIATEVPVAVLVEWIELLEELTTEVKELTTDAIDSDTVDTVRSLAQEEDIEGWSAQVNHYLLSCSQEKILFSEVVEPLGLPSSAVWLALLLGDCPYQLQRGDDDFYSEMGIEIVRKEV